MPESLMLLHPAEVALKLRVSPTTVRRYVATGRLNGVRVGPKLVKITAESVDRMFTDGQFGDPDQVG